MGEINVETIPLEDSATEEPVADPVDEPIEETSVEAIGKTISKRNALTLKSLVGELVRFLNQEGKLNPEDLDFIRSLGEAETPEEEAKEKESPLEDSVAASRLENEDLVQYTERVSWHTKLSTAIAAFKDEFREVFEDLRVTGDREEAAEKLIQDLLKVLKDLKSSHPGANGMLFPVVPGVGMIDRDFYCAKSENYQEVDIEISARNCELSPLLIASADESNYHPVSGVLFRIDEPSEYAPAQGSDTPLYISREVALEAIASVPGKPLDAHNQLDRHANNNIVGVMTNAKISENDFIIEGHLWPYNQKDQIQNIVAKKSSLGMSMNAKAVGYKTQVNNTPVFNITKLSILGANILYSNNATYNKTRILTANHDAVTSNQQQEQQEMETNQLKEIFTGLQSSLDQLGVQINETTSMNLKLSSQVDQIRDELEEIQAERRRVKAEIEASQQSKQKEAEEKQLQALVASTVSSAFDEFKKELSNLIPNASGNNNPRKSYSLVQAQSGSVTTHPEGTQAAIIQAQINELKMDLDAKRKKAADDPYGSRNHLQERFATKIQIDLLEAELARL